MNKTRFPVVVSVKFDGGAYVTQTLDRQRASATCSPEIAIERLVYKLAARHGIAPGELRAKQLLVKGGKPGATLWKVEKLESVTP